MLFSSAFDSAPTAAAAAAPLSMGKRKRGKTGPNSGNNSNRDEQLRATQANLAKLMGRMERGEVVEADREGREAMGEMGKKKRRVEGGDGKGKGKGKSMKMDQKGGKGGQQKDQQVERKGHDHGKDKGKGKGKGGEDNRKAGKPVPKSTPTKAPAKPATPTPKSAPKTKTPTKSLPAPVEIDLPTPKPKADDGLTDMQRKMAAKLEGARFRWINEQLYTTSSDDAVALMDNDPKVFADYHDTHRQLTAAWPSPPLPHITKLLAPLPKGSVIADLGCGDADLARALVPQGKVVLSYDLVGDVGEQGQGRSARGEGWVVPCDFLSGVPLPGRPGGDADADAGKRKGKKRDPAASEIVDAVVCCLSLMGTNWIGGVYEAARILKHGGAFHVAEVTSRFVSTEAFVEAITSFGLVLESQEEPSTHFTLFRFTKRTPTPVGPVRGQEGWDERVAAGEGILRACIYKRR